MGDSAAGRRHSARGSTSTSYRATSWHHSAYEIAQRSARICGAISRSPKPSVSVLEGYTTAGGFEILVNSDFAIAA
jgi:enoyl-CoA hydratase/carnithine racemase